jgi:hypothetical protein
MIILTISLFGSLSLFSFLNHKREATKMLFLFAAMFLFLLAAFRDGNTVRDYSNYVAMYKGTYKTFIEISFSIIVWLVKHIFFDNVSFLFIIYAILAVVIKIKAIKELTDLYFLSLVVYMSEFFIYHELTQMRTAVATGFLLLCIKPIYERDFRKFIAFASCAVFFHYSAFLVFFLWFIKKNPINKYVYSMLIPLAYIFHFFNVNIVNLLVQFIPLEDIKQKVNIYILLQKHNQTELNVFNYIFLVKCAIYYIILWKSKLIEKQNRYVNLLLKIETLSLVSFILFSSLPVFAWRISQLFGVVEIILIPFIYFIFKSKLLSKMFVVFIGLCIMLINIFYANLITS